MVDSIGGSSARLASRMMPITKMNTSPVTKLRSMKIFGSMNGSRDVTRCTVNTQKPVIAKAKLDPDLGRGEPVGLAAAVEHQLQRADAQREHGEAEEVEAAQPPGDARADRPRMPRKARMPTGRLMKNTQRQLKLSVSQPPSVGPTIGPTMMPAPQMAMAEPWRSFGLMSSRKVCDSGTIAAPNTPCMQAEQHHLSEAPGQAAEHRGDGEADHRVRNSSLAPEAVRQPAGDAAS